MLEGSRFGRKTIKTTNGRSPKHAVLIQVNIQKYIVTQTSRIFGVVEILPEGVFFKINPNQSSIQHPDPHNSIQTLVDGVDRV